MLDLLNISHPLLDYAIRVILCSGILWLICLAIVYQTSYRTARRVILGSVIISLLLPMWRLGVFPAAQTTVSVADTYQDAPFVTPNIIEPAMEQGWFTVEHIGLLIYGVVMLILATKMALGLLCIVRYRRNSLRTEHNGIIINVNPLIVNPFSFGRTIYMGDMEPGVEREMILTHESLHAKEHHTTEVLIMEILGIAMWINPFFYLLKKLLREVHEYQADSAVVEQGNNIEEYKLLIFSQMTGLVPELAGALTHSLTKKRLIMITQKISRNNRRALLLLPALALCAALVSFTTKEAIPTTTKTTIQSQTLLENQTRNTTPSDTSLASIRERGEQAIIDDGETNKTIIIDGKESTPNQLKELAPSSIKSVVVQNDSITVTTDETAKNVSTTAKNDEPVLSAEVMPTFMGEPAVTAFPKWCAENMKYPANAKKDLKSARIIVSLVINKQGKMESPEITIQHLEFRLEETKSIIKELNDNILEVLNSAPDKWTPATNSGKPVDIKLICPIDFKLQ